MADTNPADALPFRLPLAQGLAGTIASGTVRPGDKVRIVPLGQNSTVTRILTEDGEAPEARAGQTVTVVADPSISISGGGTICTGGNRTLTASTSGGTGSCSFQWQRATSTAGPWTNVGGNSTSYNTGAITQNFYYRALRNCSGSGCGQDVSNTVQVFLDNTNQRVLNILQVTCPLNRVASA